MTMAGSIHLTWVTSAGSPVDHAVTDDAMVAGMVSQGVYLGLCGAWFFSAPMTTSPGSVCAGCRRFLVARSSLRSAEQRMCGPRHRRRGLSRVLARLLAGTRVSESPVVPGPRRASASVDATLPAGAAGPGSGRGRVDGGARSRRVPPDPAVSGGAGR